MEQQSHAEVDDLRARQGRLEDRIRSLSSCASQSADEAERAQAAAEQAWTALADSERALAESRRCEGYSALECSQWRQRYNDVKDKYARVCRVLQVRDAEALPVFLLVQSVGHLA